jgi:hypothetical protein
MTADGTTSKGRCSSVCVAYLALCANSVSAVFPSDCPLDLLGLPRLRPTWLASQQIACGEPIVVVRKNTHVEPFEAQAIYRIDSSGEPYQVSGVHDMLLDVSIVHDLTLPYLVPLRCAASIHRAAFMALSISELVLHRHEIQEWQDATMSQILLRGLKMRTAIEFSVSLWATNKMSPEATARALAAVRGTRTPPKASRPIRAELTLG